MNSEIMELKIEQENIKVALRSGLIGINEAQKIYIEVQEKIIAEVLKLIKI